MEGDLLLRVSAVFLQVFGIMGSLTVLFLALTLWISPHIFIFAWFSGKMCTNKKEEQEILKFVEEARQRKKLKAI